MKLLSDKPPAHGSAEDLVRLSEQLVVLAHDLQRTAIFIRTELERTDDDDPGDAENPESKSAT